MTGLDRITVDPGPAARLRADGVEAVHTGATGL
jgi:hypothetical protein